MSRLVEAWDRFLIQSLSASMSLIMEDFGTSPTGTFYKCLQMFMFKLFELRRMVFERFHPGVSPDVAELKDMVRALLLDKQTSPVPAPAPVKAVEQSCVTCGGAHSYRNCPATDSNNYRDNIQEYVSQAAAANFNQGNSGYRPPPMANQIRPPGFPPMQHNSQANNQNRWNQNQNRGNGYNQGQIQRPQVQQQAPMYQPSVNQHPAYQAPAHQASGVSKTNFESYVKANDAVMQNMQNQMSNITDLLTKIVNSNQASTSSSGSLPSNTIANPKGELKAITTRSGVSYDGPQIPPPMVEVETEVTKDTVPPNKSTKDVQPPIVQVDEPVVMPRTKATLPYPSRVNKEKIREKDDLLALKFMEIFQRLFPPEKLGDPGRFLIQCDFPELDECLALADLGDTKNFSYNAMESVNKVDFIDIACEEYSQEILGFSEVLANGNSTPYFEPIVAGIDDAECDPEKDILLLEAILNSEPLSPLPNHANYFPEVRKELKNCEAKPDETSNDEPSEVELKDLPPHLEYAFLEGNNKLPVIIAKDLSIGEKAALIKVLQSHKRAIAWKLSDIKGINPEFCTHKILMEEDYTPAVQHQRRVNPKIHDVIKKEVEKLLNAGLIYPISDSPWVSPVHCVPKKGGFTVVENEQNELIPTRLVTGWRSGIEVDRAKIDVIAKLPHPTTVKGIRSFLGHAGFYRRFIQNFSKIARPMTHLLEKETPFYFSKECIEAFNTLKKNLTEAPILIAPDWNEPFELMCDASDFALGAVLGQRHEKHFRPIHYASKTMNEAESRYTTTEKEMLAVVYAFEKFRSYLVMNKCTVYTDHSALKYLFAKKDSKARLLRWVLLLQEFDFDVVDTKGAENLAADHLSRLENPHENELDPKEINEKFPLETLSSIDVLDASTPWFADIANYHAGNFVFQRDVNPQQKRKFFKDVSIISRESLFLF
ncbi:reverse transcriptase domain-containing protein [Tanacetum coccineum]